MNSEREKTMKSVISDIERNLNNGEQYFGELMAEEFTKGETVDFQEFFQIYMMNFRFINCPFEDENDEGRLSIPSEEDARKKFNEYDLEKRGFLNKDQFTKFIININTFTVNHYKSFLSK
jgi:hypothetical protein